MSQKKSFRERQLNTGTMGLVEATLLGIALVISGHAFFWNAGIGVGLAEYLMYVAVGGSAFLCIFLCLAEMTSTLPFGGGLYGFVRVTLGPYLGFLVGCAEIFLSISYTISQLLPAGNYLADIFQLSRAYSSLFWTIMLGGALAINLLGVQVFWRTNTIFICIVMTLMLLYFAVALPCLDCEKYGGGTFDGKSAHSDAYQWFQLFPYSLVLFIGLEMLPLACSDVVQPKKTIPKAFMLAFAILFVNACLVVVTGACNAPGIETMSGSEDPPFYYAYKARMHMTSQAAKALSVPALFAASSAFMYVYGKQLRSMAESGLFPMVLKHSYGPHKVPYIALLIGVGFCFLLLVLNQFGDNGIVYIFSVLGYLATLFIDITVLVAFITFRVKYTSLPQQFRSPVGVYGAYYALLILGMSFVSTLALNADAYATILVMVLYLGGFSVYYYYKVRGKQGFSEEEQRVLFVAYVINGNRKTKQNTQRKLNERMAFNSTTSPKGRTTPGGTPKGLMASFSSRTTARKVFVSSSSQADGDSSAISEQTPAGAQAEDHVMDFAECSEPAGVARSMASEHPSEEYDHMDVHEYEDGLHLRHEAEPGRHRPSLATDHSVESSEQGEPEPHQIKEPIAEVSRSSGEHAWFGFGGVLRRSGEKSSSNSDRASNPAPPLQVVTKDVSQQWRSSVRNMFAHFMTKDSGTAETDFANTFLDTVHAEHPDIAATAANDDDGDRQSTTHLSLKGPGSDDRSVLTLPAPLFTANRPSRLEDRYFVEDV